MNSIGGFTCLFFIQFLSFCCAVYLLINCITKKNIYKNLPNHLIICLLLVSIWVTSIDLLCTELFFWNNVVPIQAAWACHFYNFSFFAISCLNRMFMAFMSFERHFLVFQPQLYRTRRLRYLFHYLPIIILTLWSLTYSIVTDILLTCPQLRFRYTRLLCGFTCSLLLTNAMQIYVWLQVFFPTMVTIFACVLLPIRFLLKKRKLQRLQWRRARRMIIQMSTIASTYVFCWLPYTIILQLSSINVVSLGDYSTLSYMIFDSYVPSLLTPFICFHTMSGEMKFHFLQRIIRYFFPHRQVRIHPQNTLALQTRNLPSHPMQISHKRMA